MKHILVVGGAGFIGSNLIKRLLLNKNNIVLCIDNLETGRIENIKSFLDDKQFNKKFYFEKIDITKSDAFFDILHAVNKMLKKSYTWIELLLHVNIKIDEIYNFACPASPSKYQINPIHTLETSLAIKILCELALSYNAKLLHSSTSEIYGNPIEHPLKETYWGNVNCIGPRSCYDEGKRAAETYLYEYFNLHKAKVKIIRIFNTYGPNMDLYDGRVVSNFICQCLKNNNITIYGDGSLTRSFQYIDDLIDGIIKMMNTDDDYIGPVNLGNPEEYTVKELAEKIKKLIPETKSEIIYENLPIDDPNKRRPDISKAIKDLNWLPKIKVNDGLKKTIEYFKTVVNN